MTYKLLTEYAKQFNADFPISKVMDTMNNHEAIAAIKYCLETNTPYDSGSKASTAKDD